MDLVAVHAALPADDDLRLDAFRLAPLAPFRPAPLRQQIGLRAALQIAVVVLPEGLRAGAVVAVEVAHPPKGLGTSGLHLLVLGDQKPPLLDVVPLDRPVEAVVAHRILPAWMD